MVSIVKHWGEVTQGHYFSPSLDLIEDKKEKASLRDAFRASAAQLEEVKERLPEEALINAAATATTKWEHALSKTNWLSRWILKKFCSKEYNEFLQQLARNFVKKGMPLKDFIDQILANPAWVKNTFVTQTVAQAAMEKVKLRPDVTPPIYEISKQGEVKGYLIGTFHLSPARCFKISEIWKIVDRCSVFFEEITVSPIRVRICRWLRIVPEPTNMPIDFAMSLHALDNGSKMNALDSWRSNFAIGFWIGFAKTQPWFASGSALQRARHGDLAVDFEVYEALQKHDIEELNFLRSEVFHPVIREKIIRQRNVQWLNQAGGLVDKLYAATPTSLVCCACGINHLVGEDNLISGLEARGFILKKITQPT